LVVKLVKCGSHMPPRLAPIEQIIYVSIGITGLWLYPGDPVPVIQNVNVN